jgi:hypothetical protein
MDRAGFAPLAGWLSDEGTLLRRLDAWVAIAI